MLASALFFISSDTSVFLISLFASFLELRILTLPFSVSALADFASAIRLSSVNGGTFIITLSPLLEGLKPKLASIIPFSIS